jgi:hypothetical protein
VARLPWSRRGRSTETAEHAENATTYALSGPSRDPVREAARTQGAPAAAQAASRGYVAGIPRGGTTAYNTGESCGSQSRAEAMSELYGAYLACTWASACIDTVARTVTAGGLDVLPDVDGDDGPEIPKPTPDVQELQRLLAFINPREDSRQLYRGAITDLQIFGDAFLEIVWFLGRPVAIYSLDCPSMVPIADEHGVISGYEQYLDGNRRATFEPHEVIQISLDAPRGGIYGVSPTQKNLIPITSWLFTAALLKESMRKGNPARVHVDFPLEAQDSDVEIFSQKYQIRNLGISNIGNPIMSRGGVVMNEQQTDKITEYLTVMDRLRDTICSGYGTPPSKVGIIESGNLGGGTGTSQDKTFRVNTCGPYDELALEKLNFSITSRGFGLEGWKIRSGEVDWRDDKVVEDIRDTRLRNGSWTLDRYRAEIGEPTVDGGDVPVLVDRQNMIAWTDLAALSKAAVAAASAKGASSGPTGGVTDAPGAPDAPKTGAGQETTAETADEALRAAWTEAYAARRAATVQELT